MHWHTLGDVHYRKWDIYQVYSVIISFENNNLNADGMERGPIESADCGGAILGGLGPCRKGSADTSSG